MPPVVLITRPLPDAEEFARAVEQLGYRALIEPLLEPEYFSIHPDTPAPQAIVTTSAHAFPTPARAGGEQLPVFVMGENSLQRGREAGYHNVLSADGDYEELIALVERILVPGARILYLRGETVRHDMTARLPRHSVSEQIVYAMKPATTLGPETITALRQDEIAVVTLFSARTAEIFTNLVAREGLGTRLGGIKLLCLSGAVLESVDNLPWQRKEIASSPGRQPMLDVLRTWIEQAHE